MAQYDDQQFEDDNQDLGEESSKPQKKRTQSGSGTNWGKIILILLGVGVVSVALCCGGVIYWFKGAMTKDPVQIAAIQKEIVEIDVPPHMQPGGGMNMNIFGFFRMKMAIYTVNPGSFLILMEMQISGQTDAQMQQSFNQQAGQQQNAQFKIESSETKVIKIDGQDRNFLFAKGALTPSGGQSIPVRMITGMFPSKNGMGFIQHSIEEANYDEAEVVKMLESIHK